MPTKTLSTEAINTIRDYLTLPFPQFSVAVSCPYINNRRHAVRGALRVLIGKGTPKEIVAEAELLARKERVRLDTLDAKLLKQFLVDHNLGIDCSGLVYHVMAAELNSHGQSLSSLLHFPTIRNPLRRLLARLRPIENTGVETLAHDSNSMAAPITEVQPGAIIIIRSAGANHDRSHILLVHEIRFENEKIIIAYTHSWQAPADGKYNHGVRQGTIEIIDLNKPLLDQYWLESGKNGAENYLWRHARSAQSVEMRRLRCLQS